MGRQTHRLNSRHTYMHNLVADSNPWLPRERQEVICPNNPMTPAFFFVGNDGKTSDTRRPSSQVGIQWGLLWTSHDKHWSAMARPEEKK
jgi:hypothetical protein